MFIWLASSHLISPHLKWPCFVWTEWRAVIDRIHGKLYRLLAHDPVLRGCDRSRRTRFESNEVRWDEVRWDEMRWDEMRWDEMRWIIWTLLESPWPPKTAPGCNQPFCHNSHVRTDRWGWRMFSTKSAPLYRERRANDTVWALVESVWLQVYVWVDERRAGRADWQTRACSCLRWSTTTRHCGTSAISPECQQNYYSHCQMLH